VAASPDFVAPWSRSQFDVDLVINTHLHLDHVGWNTRLIDDQWVPTFPNARYLMPAIDFYHWNPANNPDIPGSVNEYAFGDSIAPVHAAGQVQLWEGRWSPFCRY